MGPMPDAPIRLVIVDDDALVRGGLSTILGLQPDIEVVGEAGDGRQAIQVCHEVQPDVVLMDVRMPGMDGIQATRELAREGARLRVLVVTTFENDDYVYGALHAGASGFVLKRVKPEELVQAVRIVARGESMVFPQMMRDMVARNHQPVPADDRRAQLVGSLTEREAEILRMLAEGRSNAEIADQLVLAVHTVKSHVAHVLSKLEARDRTQAVILAYETGFVTPGAS